MNATQQRALELMNERNAGAVLAGGRWVWRHTVRESVAAAADVVRVLDTVHHRSDEDCDVDSATDCCRTCGAHHSDECRSCAARAFHRDGCEGMTAPE